jgi:hypothetical protein
MYQVGKTIGGADRVHADASWAAHDVFQHFTRIGDKDYKRCVFVTTDDCDAILSVEGCQVNGHAVFMVEVWRNEVYRPDGHGRATEEREKCVFRAAVRSVYELPDTLEAWVKIVKPYQTRATRKVKNPHIEEIVRQIEGETDAVKRGVLGKIGQAMEKVYGKIEPLYSDFEPPDWCDVAPEPLADWEINIYRGDDE